MADNSPERWLVLVHQLPAKPDYLRVKIGRRLARLGAVAIKNSVYVLPNDPERVEDLEWLLREIAEGGGEGSLIAARFLGGLDDARVEDMFRASIDDAATPLCEEARKLVAPTPEDVARLRKRLAELGEIDFFGSARRAELEGLVQGLAAVVGPATKEVVTGEWTGRTWVTRRGVKVDRMASAWLIRRFIDPTATFRFVDAKGYSPGPGELRFDMFDAEFTHEGDACTFEVLVRRFLLADPGLAPIAEFVHDIDLKDGKFGRPETPGFAMMVDAIVATHPDDQDRVTRAGAVLDELYGMFARR